MTTFELGRDIRANYSFSFRKLTSELEYSINILTTSHSQLKPNYLTFEYLETLKPYILNLNLNLRCDFVKSFLGDG